MESIARMTSPAPLRTAPSPSSGAGKLLHLRRHPTNMLSAGLTVFARAVAESFSTIGQTAGGIVFSVLGLGAGLAFAYARRGTEGVRVDLQSLATVLTPFILIWLGVLAWHLLAVPYRAYQRQRETAIAASARVEVLTRTLEERRHVVDMTEPGIENMMGVIRAFQKYGRAVNPLRPAGSSPGILVSAAEDSASLAGQVTQWAVFGSGIGNGNLQNIGVRPEHLDVESRRGMLPNVLLVHVVTETPAVVGLVGDLAPLLPTKLVYTMPDVQQPIPPYVVWLQFGPGLRWTNDPMESPR